MTQGFRLSVQQQRCWRTAADLRAWCGARALYAVPAGVTPETLRAALLAQVQRHEILRTEVRDAEGLPLQFISDQANLHWSGMDWRGLSEADQARALDELFAGSLPADEGLQARWLERSAGPVLFLALSGTRGDAASLDVVMAAALAQLMAAPASTDPVQYADYAEWQYETLMESPEGAGFWRRQRAEGVGRLSLEESGAGDFAPRHIEVALPSAVAETEVFAAWTWLLAKHLAQPLLPLAVFDAGRSEEVLDACGPYARLLPLGLPVDPAASWSAWSQAANAARATALAWADSCPAGFGYEGGCEVACAQTGPDVSLQYRYTAMSSVDLEPLRAFALEARFRLRLELVEGAAGLRARLAYDASRFSPAAAQALVEQLQALLLTRSDDQPSLLDAATRARVADGLAPLREASVSTELLHELIATQAQRVPDRIAVSASGRELSYRELEARAEHLARQLVARGVGPDSIVGLCLQRSVDLITAILGVLKAGGAYLPLDPGYPRERLAYMAADSGAMLILAETATAERAQVGTVLLVEDLLAEAASGSLALPRPQAAQLAYIIYTSGSTGRPKGVAVSHANAVHSTLARHEFYTRPVAHFLLLSSYAFDSSVAGIFWTLSQGGRLSLPAEEDYRDVPALARLITGGQVSHLLALPSLYAQLLEEGGLTSLTDVIVAGEACPPALIGRHCERLPAVALHNEYGPTEGAVWCAAQTLSAGDDPVPIGGPIPRMHVYVLDEQLAALPAGVAGELYIAGPGLARGYLGRPGLTAERFLPNPFVSGERLYRTGDRVCWRPDGVLLFLGRVDHQVKIRGYRIELGEIEARLREHAAVAEAVALVREDRPGELRVVAYVVPRGAFNVESLRAQLATALPEYLLPSAYVTLTSLPLTPNGKLDRKALPAPEQAGRRYVAPRTVTESLIAGIWANVLGLPQVGVEDNFFELGGHSLMATQVVSRLRQTFGVELPVRELFAAPTVAALAAAVGARRELSGAGLAPIAPAPRDGVLPLSFAQQRLWFLSELEPDNPAYHMAGGLHLQGRLDAQALAQALQALVDRHEILRTRFPLDAQGRPVQHVEPALTLQLPLIDVSQEADVEAAAAVRARQEALRPFDLRQGPLLRACLIRLQAERHHLVLTFHHIVGDGGSTEQLLSDLTALYAQAVAQGEAGLSTLPLQYADYAVWQRQTLTDAVLAEELAWWRQRLGAEQPLLALPSDRPRPAQSSGRGCLYRFRFPATLASELKAFARGRSLTLFMLLEAAFAALLARLSGQDDIRIGTPVAGRDRLELESVAGLFVNTVVLRHDFGQLPSFEQLLTTVREAVLEAHAHQRLPFERLVDQLAPERDLSHHPLFQVMFDFQTERYGSLSRLPELSAEVFSLDTATSKFDLSLSCAEQGDDLEGVLEYSSDLFEPATVARLAEHYVALVAAALDQPGQPLADLPLLSSAEAQALSPAPVQDLPLAAGFPALFAQVVARHGERLAVDDGQLALSYRELAGEARRLAAALAAAGAGRDTPVAILAPRGTGYLTAILASFYAGAAYLPLDIHLPAERLRAMLAQGRPSVLVAADTEAAQALVASLDKPLRLVSLAAGIDGAALPPPPAHPQQLAYVIFTSGSTGTPKGAMVSQAGMLNNLLAKIAQLGLTPDDRIAQTASPCFDISVWQFLTALLCGASVQIAPDAVVREPAALLRWVEKEGISVLESVPSLMRGMLSDPEVPEVLPCLRWVLPTGEALPPELARQWFQRFPKLPLLNAYGPAECADDVALWRLEGPPSAELTHLPIGRPAVNLRLHVLNDSLQPQPALVAGELYIGGVGVGRGYLGDPVRTAQSFLPDPFGPPGSRLYRSGDLVRQDVEGVLTFLGRRDHQLKIRGYRVEPGEIEARLLQHPDLQAAAVLAVGEPARLAAYLVGKPGATMPLAEELRRFVVEVLPDYMAPAAFVTLDRLPLNANGKLDRKALPAPDFGQARASYVAPRDPAESALAQAWADVLGLSQVGIHDNFFALGGDSILSIQVVSRARGLGYRFPAKALFQHQTVAELARVAEPVAEEGERPAPQGDAPLTPVQRWFFAQAMPRPAHWNQSLLLTPREALDTDALRQALTALVAQHDALRLRFTTAGNGWRQAYVGMDHVDPASLLETLTLTQAELGAACDALQASLDLGAGPLFRAGLYALPDGSSRLLLVAHHLVVDGLSWRVLLEDLALAYQACSRGETPRLAPRQAAFADWGSWLQAQAEAGAFAAETAFWQAQTAPALPVEHPDGRRCEADIELVSASLSREDTLRLLAAGTWRATPDDFLLTALAQTLREWSGQSALLVELESHGRPDDAAYARTVGWFTAAYPLRLSADLWAPAAEQLRQTKQLRQQAGNGLGFGVLRWLSGNWQPQVPAGDCAQPGVAFNYLGQLDASIDSRLFSDLSTASGRLYDPEAPRAVEFDLNSYVLDGCLRLDWGFSRARYARATVEALAQDFLDRVSVLLRTMEQDSADLLTPQDFPDVALDQATLDQLLEGMN